MTSRLPPLTEQERAEGKTLRVDLPLDVVEELKREAAEQGIDPRELVRQYVLESGGLPPVLDGGVIGPGGGTVGLAGDVWRGVAGEVFGGDSTLIDEAAKREGLPTRETARQIFDRTGPFRSLPPDELLRRPIEGAPLSEEGERTMAILKMIGVLDRLASEWSAPYETPKTPGNVELLAMNVARFRTGVQKATDAFAAYRGTGWEEEWEEVQIAAHRSTPAYHRVSQFVGAWWEDFEQDADGSEEILWFPRNWMECGFARLEVGHKLAAALCCTEVPAEVEARGPWQAWSLVVPSGLIDETGIRRLWCVDSRWIASVVSACIVRRAPAPAADEPAIVGMIRNLVRGVCLSIADPEQNRKPGTGGHSSKKKQRHGAPVFDVDRFLLAAPVSIDLREHVAAVSSGRASAAPTVQFLVRGHWRQQAHGPARAQRKTIWIEPHWKGPEGSRVLLRSHKVRE
jgi:hypothetical protein